MEMIEPHLVFGGAVLDYGSGIGRLTRPLARAHPRTRFVGVDTNPAMVKEADAEARSNEKYLTKLGEIADLRSAYSVITFQHMTDRQVQAVIKKVYPAKFRFQFAIGDIQQPYMYQRSPEKVVGWCEKIGYSVEVSEDPDFPTWRWITAV